MSKSQSMTTLSKIMLLQTMCCPMGNNLFLEVAVWIVLRFELWTKYKEKYEGNMGKGKYIFKTVSVWHV